MAGGGEGPDLEWTPTWVVAIVCSVIVVISLMLERGLHSAGNYLKRKEQNPLYEALLKVKEELMLVGFISLLLTVFTKTITKICIKESKMDKWLPCPLGEEPQDMDDLDQDTLLKLDDELSYCARKGKVPVLSAEAVHQLHIFIFTLAIVHVTFSAMTIFIGGLKIRQWKQWEELVAKEISEKESVGSADEAKVTNVQEHDFVKDHYLGIGENIRIKGWIHSFKNQFYGSVTKSDYLTLRLGFISTHCKNNPKFDFHTYMVRTLEDDFRKVVGISWYLWIFVVFFLLINIDGVHAYFWLAFIPFFLLLATGTKLQHIITQLAHEVAEKHVAVEGDLLVKPSDQHFWFGRPSFVLFLIHFILFQNAFEMAFFLWIWAQYGFRSCIMGKAEYIFPRILIGTFIQFLTSYSTLPLYAIVTQMGSNFKKEIFVEGSVHTTRRNQSNWSHIATRRKTSPDGNGEVQLQK
uniref:MLO-like protein 1 n=1 Tax=Fragaria vesca subsp. vesca TaxID=101020 RepID=UPI0005CA7002|nr:PREDICTED: MLO-like protein 1 [Fragaria vesca subsp. vesca]